MRELQLKVGETVRRVRDEDVGAQWNRLAAVLAIAAAVVFIICMI